jgi:hypothetical protein
MVKSVVNPPSASRLYACIDAWLRFLGCVKSKMLDHEKLPAETAVLIASQHDRMAGLFGEISLVGDVSAVGRLLHDVAQPVAGIKLALHVCSLERSIPVGSDYVAWLNAAVEVMTEIAVPSSVASEAHESQACIDKGLWDLCRAAGALAGIASASIWHRIDGRRSVGLQSTVATVVTLAICRQLLYASLIRVEAGRVLTALRVRNGTVFVEFWLYAVDGLGGRSVLDEAVDAFSASVHVNIDEVEFGPTLLVRRFALGRVTPASSG